ncbi:MAG: hypothetical protein A2X49_04815 [Lentisphaerae bacterium GWF2_52_8]|nr:MAG: hypothetical protein A2X49_04815 [Lentisphaerae bacterium GWF2_52_8]
MSAKAKFTLIELLIVIAIIGILASLLFPTLKLALNTAKRIKCAGNLRDTSCSLLIYASDFREYGPTGIVGNNHNRFSINPLKNYAIPATASAQQTIKLFVCPGIQPPFTKPGYIDNSLYVLSSYPLWFGTADSTDVNTYFGFNYSGASSPGCPPIHSLLDLGRTVSTPAGGTRLANTPSKQVMTGDIWGLDGFAACYGIASFPNPHDGSNLAFMDGHVKWTARGQIETSKKIKSGYLANTTMYWGD